jgi:hypothetical protein
MKNMIYILFFFFFFFTERKNLLDGGGKSACVNIFTNLCTKRETEMSHVRLSICVHIE